MQVGYEQLAAWQTARWAGLPRSDTPPSDRVRAARHWWQVPVLRRDVLRRLPRALAPLLLAVLAAAFGAQAWRAVVVTALDSTAVAPATVISVRTDRDAPPLVTDARVRFTVDGRDRDASVLLRDRPAVGAGLSVRYSVNNPAVARAAGSADGAVLLLLVTGPPAVIALGLSAYRIANAIVRQRRSFRLRGLPSTSWLYVGFFDPRGVPGLVLCSPQGLRKPAALIPLLNYEPVMARIPTAGEVQVHGEVRSGGRVLPVVAGHVLWPMGAAVTLPSDAISELVLGDKIPDAARGIWPTRRLRDLLPRL